MIEKKINLLFMIYKYGTLYSLFLFLFDNINFKNTHTKSTFLYKPTK